MSTDLNPYNEAPVGTPKPANEIYVFGSNQAGRHGKGSALVARISYGAVLGVGEGPTERAYAIPTKDYSLRVRPLGAISKSVEQFLMYALRNPDLTFRVAKIGCLNAGYSELQIAPMFYAAPQNCLLPAYWRELGDVLG